jgi:hypothetical protein
MTTSQEEFLSEILDSATIPDGAFVYFRADLLNRIHSLLLRAYHKRHTEEELSQKDLAARIHRTTAVVNRHIAVAGNWELNTIADYFLGLRARLDVSLTFLEDLRKPQTVSAIDKQLIAPSARQRTYSDKSKGIGSMTGGRWKQPASHQSLAMS